ncbi:response regulator [Bacteroidota bacterium]
MNTASFIEILLVEDNPGDIKLTKVALEEFKILNKLNVVTDGVEALDYLFKRNKYLNAETPDLILLDLNLPKKDGREVLDEIKSDDVLKSIPVVILSTSENEDDVNNAYNRHANCYITKPIDLDQFIKVIKSMQNFWLSIVKLPNS